MKKVRKISKVYYLRQIMVCWLAIFMAFGIPAQVAMAGPPIPTPIPDLTAGPDGFAVGTGSVLQGANGNAWTNVTVQTPESIIHWETIDTLSGEDLNYLQDGVAGAAVLNRVVGGEGGLAQTLFDGNLNADSGMKIFIINTAGIVFGSTATINVSQLVASSLDIDNDDFLNGMPYTFTGGGLEGTGDVINKGTITAEAIALIGKQVINRGSLVSDAEDGYVIMAAGDTVVIQADTGVSNVAVVVTMPEQEPGDYDYIVDNGLGGDSGDGYIEADHVILAAGDIWSAAIEGVETLRAEAKGNVKFSGPIYAYAEAASYAVADVTIITGGDFTVDDQIMAEAEATGGGDNAIATVTINADGDVDINSYVKTYAKTNEGAGNATAKTTVTAANVTVDDGEIGSDAYAENGSGDATATVDIATTSSDVIVVNDSWIWSYAEVSDDSGEATAEIIVDADNVTVDNFSGIYSAVQAYSGSGNATATVDIDADGNVLVATGADGGSYIGSDAFSDDAGNTKAETTIDAGGNVVVEGDDNDKVARVYAWANEGSTNTADVKIIAGGNVEVIGLFGGEAKIEADAWYGTDNISNINITANDGHVLVAAYESGDAWIESYAGDDDESNTATVTIVADDVSVTAEYYSYAGILAEAMNGVDNTATVNVTANSGNIDVYARDSSYAEIGANTENADNNNKAEVTITAKRETSEDTEDGHVYVKAEENGRYEQSEAWIYAYANEAGNSNTSTVTVNADGDVKVTEYASWYAWAVAKIEAGAYNGQNNTANVMVDAIGDVQVIANHGAAEIRADSDSSGDNNNARVVVLADGDVKVKADSSAGASSGAMILAEAENGINNTAETIIDAVGDVLVMATNGGGAHAEIAAKAENDNIDISPEGFTNEFPVTNTARVDIDADGRVLVEAKYDSYASIEAKARNIFELEGETSEPVNVTLNDLTNTATVDIDADEVEVLAHNGGEAEIIAEAANKLDWDFDEYGPYPFPVNLTGGNWLNTATVDITALGIEYDGDVRVRAEDGGDALIAAEAYNGILDLVDPESAEDLPENMVNRASVTIDAADDVKVVGMYGGEAEMAAWTELGSDNTSTVDIEADDNVLVHGVYGEAAILAEAKYGIDNTATIGINSGGDVKVIDIGEEPDSAKIVAKAMESINSNTADITINATATTTTYEDDGEEFVEIDGGNVKVIAHDGGHAEIKAVADVAGLDEGDEGTSNSASVTINANGENKVMLVGEGDNQEEIEVEGGNLEVLVENGGDAAIKAEAYLGEENTADVEINAGGHIDVIAEDECYDGYASIEAIATNDDEMNTANIVMNAVEDVKVIGKWGGEAEIFAEASAGYDNTAGIQITTEDGDVLVHGIEGDAAIEALARWAYNTNTATVDIDAVGGDVKVIDIGYGGYGSAEILAVAEISYNSNTADIQITATATTSEYEEEGEVYVEVDGGNVLVKAKDGGHAEITAFAADAEAATNHVPNNHVGPLPEVDPTSNTANVTIRTTSAEGTRPELVKEAVYDEYPNDDVILEPAVYEAVAYTEGGDVTVIAENGSEAAIQAVTMRANENDSDVLICADGSVLVKDESLINHSATIKAIAHFGEINNAYTGVRGAEGIEVLADSGNASIASEAMFGLYCEMPAEQNTAFTSLCTDGDVLIIGQNNGTAEVLALADEGLVNNADIGVCADGDILVAAGLGTMGGTAKIKAEARAGEYYYYPVPVPVAGDGNGDYELIVTKATANVTVVSHNGGVGVIDEEQYYGPTTALIEAEAYNGDENNAYVGIAAGADLSPADLVEPEPVVTNDVYRSLIDQLLEDIMPGNVNVESYGYSGHAYILAQAYNGYENTAETVVCAPGEVLVLAEGGKASIGSQADSFEAYNNSAATRVYASEVTVSPDAYIEALGYEEEKSVTEYSLTVDGEVVDEGDEVTLIIQGYGSRENCPECPPCPECEEEETPLVIAAAALVQLPVDVPLIIRGCPVLVEAAANELAITRGTIQVSIGNALALNPTLQACDACATLIEAAAILRDEDGSRMAAMTQMFNDMAPSDAPFTPEMQALIATAFAGAAEGSQYATVMEYTDAFVQYFSVLETDLASPVGDSLAFVMDKYGAGVLGSDNSNIAAFVATRLESDETFGD